MSARRPATDVTQVRDLSTTDNSPPGLRTLHYLSAYASPQMGAGRIFYDRLNRCNFSSVPVRRIVGTHQPGPLFFRILDCPKFGKSYCARLLQRGDRIGRYFRSFRQFYGKRSQFVLLLNFAKQSKELIEYRLTLVPLVIPVDFGKFSASCVIEMFGAPGFLKIVPQRRLNKQNRKDVLLCVISRGQGALGRRLNNRQSRRRNLSGGSTYRPT